MSSGEKTIDVSCLDCGKKRTIRASQKRVPVRCNPCSILRLKLIETNRRKRSPP